MGFFDDRTIGPIALRGAVLLLAAGLLAGCAGSGAGRSAPVETRDENGFRIRETVHVGLGVRSDFERAVQLIEQEEYEQGTALLLEITQDAPYLTTAHIDLGIAYARTGDWERAEQSLLRALELNPRHPVANNELGIVYRRTGRFAEARESYERVLERYPDFHFARRNLAILCDVFLEDRECALEQYEIYSKAVPDDEEAAIWIADLKNRSLEKETP